MVYLAPPSTAYIHGIALSSIANVSIGKAETQKGRYRRYGAIPRCAQVQQAMKAVYEGRDLQGPLEDEGLVFYTHTLCPYAQRVWLAILEKEVDFSMVHIDLAHKPGWYRSVNPSGLVPAATYQGSTITESIDICRWLDASFAGPALVPQDKEHKRIMEEIMKQKTSSFVSAGLDLLAGSTGRSWGIGSGQRQGQRTAFLRQVSNLDSALQASGGPYLAGPAVSLADIVVWPFVMRFDIAVREFCGLDMRNEAGGAMKQWLDLMASREPCKESDPDKAAFLTALRKERSLDFFDFTTYSAASLHPRLGRI